MNNDVVILLETMKTDLVDKVASLNDKDQRTQALHGQKKHWKLVLLTTTNNDNDDTFPKLWNRAKEHMTKVLLQRISHAKG